MDDEQHQDNTEDQRRRRELVALSPVALIAIAFGINIMGVLFESWGWNWNTFGRLGVAWFLFGVGLLFFQIVTRKFRWSLVLVALAIAVVAFCVNFDMVAKITASV